MRIIKVKYGKKTHDNDGFDAPTPKSVNVELTLAEATFISKVFGEMNSISAEEVFSGADAVHLEIYNCLNGDFLNRHFFDGADDAVRMVSS
jgi:hypothetical protein